jgi:hypothetical protein
MANKNNARTLAAPSNPQQELLALHNLLSDAEIANRSIQLDLARLNNMVDRIQESLILAGLPTKLTWWWIVTHVDTLVTLVKRIIDIIKSR